MCNEYITLWPKRSLEKAGFNQQHVKVWFESCSSLNALLFSSSGGGCAGTSASVCHWENCPGGAQGLMGRCLGVMAIPEKLKNPKNHNAEERMLLMPASFKLYVSQLMEGNSDLAQVWKIRTRIKK